MAVTSVVSKKMATLTTSMCLRRTAATVYMHGKDVDVKGPRQVSHMDASVDNGYDSGSWEATRRIGAQRRGAIALWSEEADFSGVAKDGSV